MAQLITTAYHGPDTAENANRKFVEVVKPGVYSGYLVNPNGSSSSTLDIVTGGGTSVLVTSQGIRVEETDSLIGAVTIDEADVSLDRYDLVVAEYEFSANTNVVQTYKVIRGANQTDTTIDPVRPSVQNDFQVPLAYVLVRAKSNFTGVVIANVELTDIHQIPRADWLDGPEENSNMLPWINPLDNQRLYVFPGIFLSVDGRSLVEFEGGHSSVIDPSPYADNEVIYFQYGVTDSGAVEVIGSASSEAGLPDLTRDTFVLAQVQARKSFGVIILESIKDLRFPFARRQAKVDEEDRYNDLLADSVFEAIRIERFVDDSLIQLTTVQGASGSTTSLAAVVDSKDTSLTVTWSGSTLVPTEVVYIATGNVLSGAEISTAEHIMLAVDAPFNGLTFQYSTSSSTGGFTAETFRPNEIVRLPAGGTSELYIRFVIPRQAFAATKEAKLFSFAVLYNLDDEVLNTNSIGELGITTLRNSVNNLIANGSFHYWSRLDVDGNDPDLSTLSELSFALDTNNINLADGWQATSLNTIEGGVVKRKRLTDLSLDGVVGMELTTAAAADAPTYVEYRVPVASQLRNRPVSFAISFQTGAVAGFGIGIAQYRRATSGLVLKQKDEVFNTSVTGTLTISTVSPLPDDVEQIGFYLIYNGLGAANTTTVYDARAISGNLSSVPVVPVPNASSVLRQYYERGRAYASVNAQEGQIVGVANNFGTPKAAVGTPTANVFSASNANRSSNVTGISLDAQTHSVLVSASATSTGVSIIDVDWEAYVTYESSPAS